MAETAIQHVYSREGFCNNKAMKNIFVVTEEKKRKVSVLRISKVLLMSSLKGQGDRSEK